MTELDPWIQYLGGALFLLIPLALFFYTLNLEKEGARTLTEVGQELNNKKLHEAGEKLFNANKIKWILFYIVIAELVIAFYILRTQT